MMQLLSHPSELNVDDPSIVLLPVRLTLVESRAFKESCLQLLEKKFLSKKLFLDFHQNTFIDCSGIRVLVTLYKIAISNDIELIIKNVTPSLMIVLELTKLDQIFTIEH